jgi:hypothetical protein
VTPYDEEPPHDVPPLVSGGASRWRPVVAVLTAIMVVGGGAVAAVLLATDGDAPADNSTTPADLPAELSGAGTPLPDGMTVPDGAELVGPVVVSDVAAPGEPAAWFAVLAVVGDDPLPVWSDYIGQIAAVHPDLGLDAAAAPGCTPYDAPDAPEDGSPHIAGLDPLCELNAGRVSAELTSTMGDVTGRWLLTVSGNADRDWNAAADRADIDTWPELEPPRPQPARPRPGVGEPLAPNTTAYDGDAERYVLVDGSELVAQYGAGSITGGFGVLLRVTPGADIADVAAAYAEQAVQFEGEPVPPPDVVRHDGTTVTRYWPPGGAGGYTGTITAVDRPGTDDYILYELSND